MVSTQTPRLRPRWPPQPWLAILGVVVWEKSAKPALERRRASRAERKAAEERSAEGPTSLSQL
ncbi:hypothetical protein LJ754_16365 [Arthrobacter sp. zg-Y40]|uniref:hypothetical protein n=1 Tax=Arthrobacter sp. zg-Y40 TaxID=2886939 RepID=UPI001D14D18F|nr:hypothetical protein [Arthrobacter sp. zg-Y40]MCC3280721.1 hypothetical protein [Arthrobacter sp. zg-Y40]